MALSAAAFAPFMPVVGTILPRVGPLVAEVDPNAVTLLVTEQLLVLATLVGAIAAMPVLMDYLADRRKRRERVELSLDDVSVAELKPRLAGMDGLLASIADLIDRARRPERYAGLDVGNELLIIGPPLSGKKTLAQRIAKEAAMDRLITVYNPRHEDVLARAKALLKAAGRQKIVLLLPRIDLVFERDDLDLRAELDALIETSSERENVLVVGTALACSPDSDLDNLFGIKILMPGAVPRPAAGSRAQSDAQRAVLADVAAFYLQRAFRAGFRLDGLTEDAAVTRVLTVAGNPAEIEDIITLCQTAALHRSDGGAAPAITADILSSSIGRVIPGAA